MNKRIGIVVAFAIMGAATLFPFVSHAATKSSVLIYTTTVSGANNTECGQPIVMDVWKKVGSGTAIKLLTVTGATCKQQEFVLSPSHKTLAINLGTSLMLYNMQTKATKTYTDAFYHVSFSTDGKTLYGVVVPGASGEFVLYALKPWTDTYVTYPIHTKNFPLEVVSRSDGKVLFYSGPGLGGIEIWRANLTTGKLTTTLVSTSTTGGGYATMTSDLLFSDDRILVATERWSSDNKKLIGYDFVNTLTGKKYGYITSTAKRIIPLAISPDDSTVLFSSGARTNSLNAPKNQSYYLAKLRDGTVTPVADYLATLRTWNSASVGAYNGVNSLANTTISRDGKTLVRSALQVFLRAQYWQ